jgi:imidazolonepropionase
VGQDRVEEIVPRVAREKLARFCDVFCERDSSARGLGDLGRRGAGLGQRARELTPGGALLAAELRAPPPITSCPSGIKSPLAWPALWPSAFRGRPADVPGGRARSMIDAGVPVAVVGREPGHLLHGVLPAVAAHACSIPASRSRRR